MGTDKFAVSRWRQTDGAWGWSCRARREKLVQTDHCKARQFRQLQWVFKILKSGVALRHGACDCS